MNKRGLEFETLGKWIIALIVLVIIILGITILRGKGSELMDKFLDIVRFGR